MKGLVSYFIDLGYDAEDLMQNLGLTKSVSFLHRLLYNHADKLEEHSPNFLVQLEDFIRGNLKQMNKLQLVRMLEIAKIVPRFAQNGVSDNDLIEKIEA